MTKGIAESTAKTYASAQKLFLDFCSRLRLCPLPASEETLVLFVSEAAQSRTDGTIRCYLSGIRHLHIMHGFGNPLERTLRLDLVLRGIHRIKPKVSRPRLPITRQILRIIKSSLNAKPGFDSTMLWPACCTAFFGFMRCAEFTTTSPNAYDKHRHLLTTDVSVDSHCSPSMVAIRVSIWKWRHHSPWEYRERYLPSLSTVAILSNSSHCTGSYPMKENT